MPRSSPSLDMTPMVDLAFLLVTFFMLTTQFRAQEPVVVDTPSSVSEKILPDNVMIVTIDDKGRPFFNITGKEVRANLIKKMGQQYKIAFTEDEIRRFSIMTSFGVPIAQLKEYISLDESARNKIKSPGIPMDSLDNQLSNWIHFGRIESAKESQRLKDDAAAKGVAFNYEPLRFAIKADGKANYISVKEVIETFKKRDIYRFNLITDLEGK